MIMKYTQLLQAQRKAQDEGVEEPFVASVNGVLFHNWDNYIKYPSANDSGSKRKKKLW